MKEELKEKKKSLNHQLAERKKKLKHDLGYETDGPISMKNVLRNGDKLEIRQLCTFKEMEINLELCGVEYSCY